MKAHETGMTRRSNNFWLAVIALLAIAGTLLISGDVRAEFAGTGPDRASRVAARSEFARPDVACDAMPHRAPTRKSDSLRARHQARR